MSPFALDATIAAFNEEEQWVEEVNNVIDTNLALMASFIEQRIPKIQFSVPEATYLAWLDFSEFGLEEADLLNLLADEAHLVLEGGSMFGEMGRGFIRMNVACPTAVIQEALDRLERVFASR